MSSFVQVGLSKPAGTKDPAGRAMADTQSSAEFGIIHAETVCQTPSLDLR
ncbi:hypothetical protein [Bradyrhizobium iriomotense]|nr:hypothetical protein [Bradyrhizobium iriomotense]